MLIVGLPLGLGAALLQAGSYLVSRHAVAVRGMGPLRLLVLAHPVMMVGALLLLAWVWREPVGGWPDTIRWLAQAVCSYLAAQGFFFWTIRYVPASRVAPMMGAKVVVLALAVHLLGLEVLNLQHWLGVGLVLAATWAVNSSAEPLRWRALLGLLLTITCFASSDIGISQMISAIDPRRSFGGAMMALGLNYLAGGMLALLALPALRPRADRRAWRRAALYALVWLTSMLCLFGAIALAGVVLAIICQALRGPVSVLLGALVARRGHHGLEAPMDRRSLLRQLAAAALTVAATAVYALA